MIEGTVRIEELDDANAQTTVVVRLQDVSAADAASQTVAEVEVEDAFGSADGVRFQLAVPDGLDPLGNYILAAHADVDGSGDISVGDFITMTSNPVVIDSSNPPIELQLRLVTS